MGRQLWKPGNMLYPVPAVMVTCQREGGQPNIITIAWAGTVCSSRRWFQYLLDRNAIPMIL